MSFQSPAQRKTLNKKSPSIPTRNANPTGSAGSKNSNGPKGGSAKSGVPANRDSVLKKLSVPAKGQVPAKNNPKQIVRSSRINYRSLKSKKSVF